jgi:hypothetical protein
MVPASMPPGSSGGNRRTIRQILSASDPLCGGSRFPLMGVGSLWPNLSAYLQPDSGTLGSHIRRREEAGSLLFADWILVRAPSPKP